MAKAGLGKLAIIGGIIAIIMLAIIFIPAIISPSVSTSDLFKYNESANSTIKVVEGTSKLSSMVYSVGLPTIMLVLGLFALIFIVYFAAKRLMRRKK